jgi:branched-subunit amino acid transport protein
MDFIETYNLKGLAIGIFTFLVIGVFHPVVIKAEYYFGTRCWWCFLLAGLAGIAGALCVREVLWSSVLGVVAFSCFWSIKELFQQRERVRKGWFPARVKEKP